MTSSVVLTEKLQKELINITKKESPAEAIKELLKRELIRKKNKYLYMIRDFEGRYNMKFEDLEGLYKERKNDKEIEKTYFDWDMAITVLEDIEKELKGIE